MIWKKRTHEEIKQRVFTALAENMDYSSQNVLGVPASYLDGKVFSQDNDILKNAPFLTSLVRNPNHIGCHTLGSSESFFAGTQEIEREVIRICAEDILKSNEECDGYVASGGTEANIQAIWIYRNYFVKERKADLGEIAILCSEDSHYSMVKAANLLNISVFKAATDNKDHSLSNESVQAAVEEARTKGINYFIVVANMMTTMFGSVDNPGMYANVLRESGVEFKMHVDAAFGGFYYPFSNRDNVLNFENQDISSVTLDAHKMAQAPYGTGIFLIRKGYMKYANTKEASYVEGEDSTLIGSRSGANAISIWMILSTYGFYGWMEKIFILQKRTDWLCQQLDQLDIKYYRNAFSNIVTLESNSLSKDIAGKYGLVPDNHSNPNWFKIVVMEHVQIENLQGLLNDIKDLFALENSVL